MTTSGPSGPPYCINCGARLEDEGAACRHCAAPPWRPDAPVAAEREPAERDGQPPTLGTLPWFYAAGAILFLVRATQTLAILVSPAGRSQLVSELAGQGYPVGSRSLVVTAYGAAIMVWLLVAAGLHGAAFYGLRARRRWGWLAAVLIAGGWSLLLVGIPVFARLVSRDVRRGYGVG